MGLKMYSWEMPSKSLQEIGTPQTSAAAGDDDDDHDSDEEAVFAMTKMNLGRECRGHQTDM